MAKFLKFSFGGSSAYPIEEKNRKAYFDSVKKVGNLKTNKSAKGVTKFHRREK